VGYRAFWLVFAGLNGAIAVAAGAYASHGFPPGAREAEWLRLASQHQLLHALALVALALGSVPLPTAARRAAALAGWLFVAGILLFCGALYALAFRGTGLFPMMAPLGGSSFIVGWLALAAAGGAWAVKARSP